MDSLGKLSELLKASGWQLAGIAAACWALWQAGETGLIPKLEGLWLTGTFGLGLLAAGLAAGALASELQKAAVRVLGAARRPWYRWRFQRRFIAEIPHMSERSKIILGYLRHYKKRHFEIADDGGHAAGLLGSGYVHFNARDGQSIDMTRVPAVVHEAIWPLILKRPEDFPHKPEYSTDSRHGRQKVETHPWRIPWG